MFQRIIEAKVHELSQVMDHLVAHEVFRIGPAVVTSTVVSTWVVMAVLIPLVILLTRNLSDKPRGVQHVLEMLVEFLHGIIEQGMGKVGRRYLFLVGTVFVFILFLNLSWFIPGMVPPTTDINTTAALAVVSYLIVQIIGLRQQGLGGYLRHYIEPVPFLLPMNIIEQVVRPFSLAVRLFGNLFGGKTVVTILAALIPLILPVPVMMLEILTGFIQAFVFATLTVVYLAAIAIRHDDHHAHGESH